MAVRKIKATQIFDGHKLQENKVLIAGMDGTVLDILDDEAVDTAAVEQMDGILSPGLINAHCHVELSHLKGAIDMHTGLVDFISKVIRLRSYDKAEIAKAIEQADQQMFDNGIEAVGDICNTTDTLSQKQNSKIRYRNFIEVMGFLPEAAKTRFEGVDQLVYAPFAGQNSHTTIVPHAPYSVSEPLFGLINEKLKKSGKDHLEKIVSIHNQETPEENLFFETGESKFRDFYQLIKTDLSGYKPSGKSSLKTYFPWLKEATKVLLVHNTVSTTADIEYVLSEANNRQQEIFWVLCPGANNYIENKLPPVELLLKHGCNIALGTDSLASNHHLSILHEMKILQTAFPGLGLELVLQWATYNGAAALGFEQQLGSFSKGTRPGVLLLKEDLTALKRVF